MPEFYPILMPPKSNEKRCDCHSSILQMIFGRDSGGAFHIICQESHCEYMAQLNMFPKLCESKVSLELIV